MKRKGKKGGHLPILPGLPGIHLDLKPLLLEKYLVRLVKPGDLRNTGVDYVGSQANMLFLPSPMARNLTAKTGQGLK